MVIVPGSDLPRFVSGAKLAGEGCITINSR
jgi:hypothetical protein